MIRHFIISILIAAPLCSALDALQNRPVPDGNWTTVENFVQQAFFLAHSSGSLMLSGTCRTTQQGSVVVSDTISSPPPAMSSDFSQAMIAVSQQDPHLSWARDANGYIRVKDDRVTGVVTHFGSCLRFCFSYWPTSFPSLQKTKIFNAEPWE